MSETKTLHKWFWVWEFEKEERWLNEMAQEGWALTCGGFCTYTFEKCEPGEYIIRVETLDNSSDFENFMEELGAESVGRCFRWGYFRCKAELGEFNMFSDIDSRIAHLDKIGKYRDWPCELYLGHQQPPGLAQPVVRCPAGLRAGAHSRNA